MAISFKDLYYKFGITLTFLGEENDHLLSLIKFYKFSFSIESNYKHQIWFKYKPDFTHYIKYLESDN